MMTRPMISPPFESTKNICLFSSSFESSHCCYNSYNDYISTKRNPENHGIGLHTVGKLVEKYGGVMKIEAGEEEFSVKIVFTVK